MDGWDARLGADERGRNILQLQHGERGQLLVDALEHVVVQVPGLVQLGLLAAGAVLLAPLVRLRQLAPVRLRAQARYKIISKQPQAARAALAAGALVLAVCPRQLASVNLRAAFACEGAQTGSTCNDCAINAAFLTEQARRAALLAEFK